jgi:hypothetical protein
VCAIAYWSQQCVPSVSLFNVPYYLHVNAPVY